MDYTDMYMYYWWLGLAGSRHWSTYMYCLLVSYHSAPRLYIRTGWSVVRQTDRPCQFFCRKLKTYLDLKMTFQESKQRKPGFILFSVTKAWTDLSLENGNKDFVIKYFPKIN